MRRLSFASLSPLTVLAAFAAFTVACGDSGAGGSGTGTGGTTSSSTSTGKGSSTSSGMGGNCSGTIGDGGSCPGQHFGGGETSQATASVKAKIVDEMGQPVANQPVYICGVDICSEPGMTSADGSVSLSTTIAMMKKPAFKFGDSLAYSEFGIPLTAATTDFTTQGTGVLATGKLTGTTGAQLLPGATATSGDVMVSIPAGATVTENTLVYDTCDKQLFHAATVGTKDAAPIFDSVMINGGPADFSLLYAVSPAGTTICPAAKVTVALPHAQMAPNDLGWAPGDKVEFWVMTVDAAQEFAPYAGWAKASDGTVDANGTTATTDDGKGFIYLDNFAVRKAN